MIKYAILGLLSRGPCSGYDLKKAFNDSSILYWSGNNNQIYRSLLELAEEGMATYEVVFTPDLPAKKVYSVTDKGLAELKTWLCSMPENPELRSSFLIRLAWADLLNDTEFEAVLDSYEEEVRIRHLMEIEKAQRDKQKAGKEPREAFFLEMISENIISYYKSELTWIDKLRAQHIRRA